MQGPCLSVDTVNGVLLLWLMAQEGACRNSTRPKAMDKCSLQLLLLDRPFLPKLAAALVPVAEVFVEGFWSP